MQSSSREQGTIAKQTNSILPDNVAYLLNDPKSTQEFVMAIRDFMCVSFGFKDPGYLHYLEVKLLGTVSTLLKKNFNNPQLGDDFFKQLAKQLVKPFLQPKQNDKFIRRVLEKVPEWLSNNDKVMSLVMDKNTYVIATFIRRVSGRTYDSLTSYAQQCSNNKPKIYINVTAMHKTALGAQIDSIEDLLRRPDSSMSEFTKKHYIEVRNPDFYLRMLRDKGSLSSFLLFPILLMISFVFLSKIQLKEYQILPAFTGCFMLTIVLTLLSRQLEIVSNKTFYFHEDVLKCYLNGIILNHLETSIAESLAVHHEIAEKSAYKRTLPRRLIENTSDYADTQQQNVHTTNTDRLANMGNKYNLEVEISSSLLTTHAPKKIKRKFQEESEKLIKKHKKHNEAALQKLLNTQEKTLYFNLLYGANHLECHYEPFALYTPITEPYVVSELWSDAVGRKSMNDTHLMIWHRAEMKRAFKKIQRHSTELHDDFLETHVYAHIVNAQGYSGFVPCPEYDEAIDGNPVSFKSKLLSGVYRVPYTEQKTDAITWTNGTEKNIRKVHYALAPNKVH